MGVGVLILLALEVWFCFVMETRERQRKSEKIIVLIMLLNITNSFLPITPGKQNGLCWAMQSPTANVESMNHEHNAL